MKNKIGWIVVASLVTVLGLFYIMATTVLAPETQLVRELERFLSDNSFKKKERSDNVTADNGRPAVDTYYELEVASESEFWDVDYNFDVGSWLEVQDVRVEDASLVAGMNSTTYLAPTGFRQIAEVQWVGPEYGTTTWPQTITVRVRRYVEDR